MELSDREKQIAWKMFMSPNGTTELCLYAAVSAVLAERNKALLEITEKPEWFDTPCARAIREALQNEKGAR